MSGMPPPRALVVYESMFDNTKKLSTAIVEGLRSGGYDVAAVDVRWAAAADALSVDLLVLGAPTHAFSLSRPTTRADAVRQGAASTRATIGMREWLGSLGPPTSARPLVAIYDTRVSKVRRLPTSAGRTAAKLARRRGFAVVGRVQGFLVEDVRGPLLEGELARATVWGREIGEAAIEHGTDDSTSRPSNGTA